MTFDVRWGRCRRVRAAAVSHGIPCITTISAADAAVLAMEAMQKEEITVQAVQDRFPNYTATDKALVFLGQANLKAGLLGDAIGVYRKLFYMNYSEQSRREACIGAARGFWLTKDLEQTRAWATRYVGLASPPDSDLAEAYVLIGRSEADRNNTPEAVAAYYHALAAGPSPQGFPPR